MLRTLAASRFCVGSPHHVQLVAAYAKSNHYKASRNRVSLAEHERLAAQFHDKFLFRNRAYYQYQRAAIVGAILGYVIADEMPLLFASLNAGVFGFNCSMWYSMERDTLIKQYNTMQAAVERTDASHG